jgi:hypothetical protein
LESAPTGWSKLVGLRIVSQSRPTFFKNQINRSSPATCVVLPTKADLCVISRIPGIDIDTIQRIAAPYTEPMMTFVRVSGFAILLVCIFAAG